MSEKEAPVDDSVVARADALMQRRRAQPLRPPPNNDLPILTEAVLGTDDDLPVLTTVDSTVAFPLPLPERPEPLQLDKLGQELTRRVHDRLSAELPCLVEAAVQSVIAELSRELEQGLMETTEAAIRDFIHERGNKARR